MFHQACSHCWLVNVKNINEVFGSGPCLVWEIPTKWKSWFWATLWADQNFLGVNFRFHLSMVMLVLSARFCLSQFTRKCTCSAIVKAPFNHRKKTEHSLLEILYNKEICHLQLKKRRFIRLSSKFYYKSGQWSADFIAVVRVHKPSSCPTDYTFCFHTGSYSLRSYLTVIHLRHLKQ